MGSPPTRVPGSAALPSSRNSFSSAVPTGYAVRTVVLWRTEHGWGSSCGVAVRSSPRSRWACPPGRPSVTVLAAIAAALRLTGDEETHLYRLAGQTAPVREDRPQPVDPGLAHLLEAVSDTTPVFVTASWAPCWRRTGSTSRCRPIRGPARSGRESDLALVHLAAMAAPARSARASGTDRGRVRGGPARGDRSARARRTRG